MNARGIWLMIYSLAIFVGSIICNYGGQLRKSDRATAVICGIIIGAFWLKEIRRESRKNKRRKY